MLTDDIGTKHILGPPLEPPMCLLVKEKAQVGHLCSQSCHLRIT